MPAPELPPHPIARMLRIVAWAGVVAVGAFCLLLLALRLVVLPQVGSHREELAHWLGAKLGQPVSVGEVLTGWDGWNPQLSVRGLRIGASAPGARALLDLPRVDLVVAWTSLPLFDLRLKELSIESPTLFVRRDAEGRLHVAGVEVESDAGAADSAVADWLLRQPRVVVHDALVVWNDEYRRAPQLVLDHVDFRLERRFGRVRVGLTGVPPSSLAAPLDLRADFSGASLEAPSGLDGRVYLRLDYADLGAWANWLPVPVQVDRGEGALRMWVDVKAGQPARFVADLEVHDLQTTLDPALGALTLGALAGRFTWTHDGDRHRVRADHLAVTLPDGMTMTSGRLDAVYDGGDGGRAPRGSLAFDRLELAPLAELCARLPLPAAWRETLAALAPRGSLSGGKLDWSGEASNPESFTGSVRFANVGFAPHGNWPGVDGVSGTLDANQDHGSLALEGIHASVALPRVLAQPIALDTLRGKVEWDRRDAPLAVTFDAVEFANTDAAGTVTARWRDDGTGPGRASVTAKLTRAKASAVWRYVPSSVPESVRAWLRRALAGGDVTAATVTMDGNLADFPFRGGRAGAFTVDVHAQDVTLDYAEGWPALTGIAADVRFSGPALAIDVSRGQALGASIGSAKVNVHDLGTADPLLSVAGTATGATAEFLDFASRSPVAESIGHAADGWSVSGDARLALAFRLPLAESGPLTVDGTLSLGSNSLRIGGGPPIDALSGDLLFSQKGVEATAMTGEVLGGPATFSFSGRDGGATLAASGSADLTRLRDTFAVTGVDRVGGRASWKLDATLRNGTLAWSAEADLRNATIDLPAPLAKHAGVDATLRVARSALDAHADRIVVDGTLADPLHAVIDQREVGGRLRVERVGVTFGNAARTGAEATVSADAGSSVRGNVTVLDADGWLAFLRSSARAADDRALELTRLDVDAGTLILADRRFPRTRMTAVRAGERWQATLVGTDLAGRVTWEPADVRNPHGRMSAHLERLVLPKAPEADAGAVPEASAAFEARRVADWPALDLDAAAFVSHGHALGSLAIAAEPTGKDWTIRTLSVVNDAGRIDAHGIWRTADAGATTTLEGEVNVKEAGAFMKRFGWPDVVKGAPSKISGRMTWKGSPADFDYASLSGAFALDAGAGQFTKIEPGVGRLLGVLSLQALPRRIGLDFRDVFSQGFAFDKASGKVTMHEGIMQTGDLRLTGPSAVVDIGGEADLARETQHLKVKIEPALASGVSAGAAALFLANPLIGAAVGAGTLLAQKLLHNPFDQMFSYEYLVSGSWDDPIVTRAAAATATSAPAPLR